MWRLAFLRNPRTTDSLRLGCRAISSPGWGRVFTACALLILTGCGFTEGFNKGFDKSFRESCLNGALKKGADRAVAEKYCECALVKFKETKSMDKAAEACAPK